MLMPLSIFPSLRSERMGIPVKNDFSIGKYFLVSGNAYKILVEISAIILLASPGDRSDSCVITGFFNKKAAKQTGKLTKPPFEKIIFGLYLYINFKEVIIPDMVFKISKEVFEAKISSQFSC